MKNMKICVFHLRMNKEKRICIRICERMTIIIIAMNAYKVNNDGFFVYFDDYNCNHIIYRCLNCMNSVPIYNVNCVYFAPNDIYFMN